MSSSSAPRRPRRAFGLALVVLAVLAVATFAVVQTVSDSPSSRDAQPAGDVPPLEDLSRGEEPESRPGGDDDARVPAFGTMAWRGNDLGPADFALIRSSGARLYRFNVLTSSTDDREPPPKPERYDRLIRAGTPEGIEFLPVLLRSRRDPAQLEDQVAEPPENERELAVWRERVRFFAERYGPEGGFWRENPDLPYRPIRAWEVWNEPNLDDFWDDREADPREYARLLRETRTVLRSVDPEARIVSAGLASRYDGASYLSAVLEEVGPCRIDAIGIHPYAPTADGTMDHLADTRRAADAGGAGDVPLWTTEVGWRVGSSSYTGVPDAEAQADRYRRFLADVERRGEELRLGPILAFALRDRVDPETGKVDNRTGLRGADDRPRPAWNVFARAARPAPEQALPPARECGR